MRHYHHGGRSMYCTYGLLAAEDILVGTVVGIERGAAVVFDLTGDGATGFCTGWGGWVTGLGGVVALGFESWYVGGGGFVSLGSETGVLLVVVVSL